MSDQQQRIADAGLVLKAAKAGFLRFTFGDGLLRFNVNLDEHGLPILTSDERDALQRALDQSQGC